jgi:hypothetical protein
MIGVIELRYTVEVKSYTKMAVVALDCNGCGEAGNGTPVGRINE